MDVEVQDREQEDSVEEVEASERGRRQDKETTNERSNM